MAFLTELWLPILLSAVFVFVVSSILHMVLPVHKGDWGKLANEEQAMDTLREGSPQPGLYMFPCPGSMSELANPEVQAAYDKGPVGYLTVLPNGVPNVGKNLLCWFIYSIIVGTFVAYVGWHAVGAGATYLAAFRVTGAAAVLAYATSAMPESIWKGQPWNVTAKFMFDGLLYGLVTAGAFAWLWPN